MNLQQLVKDNQGTIVDMRTYEEFKGGHVSNSINIELNEVPKRIEEMHKLQ